MRRGIIKALPLLFLGACAGEDLFDSQCPAGELFVEGVCRSVCNGEPDCPGGVCVNGICQGSQGSQPQSACPCLDEDCEDQTRPPLECTDFSTCEVYETCTPECPTAPEDIANGVDDDCDGGIDEDAVTPCTNISCGDHSICQVIAGQATCSCEPGFVDDGAGCVARPTCDGVSCGNHSICEVIAGQATCSCESGFVKDGAGCVAEAGSPCDGVSCGNHRFCEVIAGQATCSCEPGFVEDGAGCVPDESNPCDGETCSGHGSCVVVEGAAECQCENRYLPAGLACEPDPSCTCDGKCAGADDGCGQVCAADSCGSGEICDDNVCCVANTCTDYATGSTYQTCESCPPCPPDFQAGVFPFPPVGGHLELVPTGITCAHADGLAWLCSVAAEPFAAGDLSGLAEISNGIHSCQEYRNLCCCNDMDTSYTWLCTAVFGG